MTAHIHLGLVFHQHQPLGNYGFVFDDLYQKSYEPLLAALERHPGVKAGLHTSGPLLDWLRDRKPEYMDRLQRLVERAQVEILGGGYYEPILPAISEADRVGQLTKMRRALGEIHGAQPAGAWIAERVWEPELPVSLAAAGYDWTIVDDVHFEAAGFPTRDLRGWYLTEEDGHPVGLFASSTELRYLIPWGTVDQCVDFLGAQGDRYPGSLVAMGDDAEKFGGWPTTYKHCWEDGWVDAFFARLERETGWLETVHLGEWKRLHPAAGLAYLPSTSYMEMGEWSLPPAAQHDLERAKGILEHNGGHDLIRFLRGGHWRNFFVRYPEVNLLHKRLLIVSREAQEQGNKEAIEEAWQAQCNCPFWHGVFGGVYLEHIRHANFGHLAAADAALHPGPRPADERDWDMDGEDEVCLRSEAHTLVVDPADGGVIQHWDLRHHGWHLTHAIARRPEAYHQGLHADQREGTHSIHDTVRAKDEQVIGQAGVYDVGMRLAAQDTVVAGYIPREGYRDIRLRQSGTVADSSASGHAVTLSLETAAGRMTKVVRVAPTVGVSYRLGGDATLFSEWNLSIPQGENGDEPAFRFDPGVCTITSGMFTLHCSHNADDAWVERLYSVSNTEGGVELAPQGWALVFSARSTDAEPRSLDLDWSVMP